MQQSKMPPIGAIDFRADSYSPDGKTIIVSLATKYSAERRTYSVPVQCLYDFVADLKKLKSTTATTPIQTSGQLAPVPAKDLNRIKITVPKKWMLRSGLPDHPLVVMVFDPQTEAQAGYALTATAAREMAVALVKYADTLAQHQASKQKANGNQQRTVEE
jgi:hypothetical protein